MKSKILVFWLTAVLAWAGALWAQQPKRAAAKGKGAGKAAAAQVNGQGEPQPRVDGDAAYKANCARCHQETRKFPERRMATIMQHMRVRANLTQEEVEAILKYLAR